MPHCAMGQRVSFVFLFAHSICVCAEWWGLEAKMGKGTLNSQRPVWVSFDQAQAPTDPQF